MVDGERAEPVNEPGRQLSRRAARIGRQQPVDIGGVGCQHRPVGIALHCAVADVELLVRQRSHGGVGVGLVAVARGRNAVQPAVLHRCPVNGAASSGPGDRRLDAIASNHLVERPGGLTVSLLAEPCAVVLRPSLHEARVPMSRVAGGDAIDKEGRQAPVRAAPVNVLGHQVAEDVVGGANATVVADDGSHPAGHRHNDRAMPVSVRIARGAAGRLAVGRKPVGSDAPGRTAVGCAVAAQVAADHDVGCVRWIDRQRQVIPCLGVADVEVPAVAGRRGVGRHRRRRRHLVERRTPVSRLEHGQEGGTACVGGRRIHGVRGRVGGTAGTDSHPAHLQRAQQPARRPEGLECGAAVSRQVEVALA